MHKHVISFSHAFAGIWLAITSQANIRIHVLVGSVVLLLATYLNIPFAEILVLILTIAMVLLAEMINTAIEFLADGVTLEHQEYIKHTKDVAAGAVLLTVIFAVCIGLIIFVPKVI
jgi:diacylglycerol kinase (ATP)